MTPPPSRSNTSIMPSNTAARRRFVRGGGWNLRIVPQLLVVILLLCLPVPTHSFFMMKKKDKEKETNGMKPRGSSTRDVDDGGNDMDDDGEETVCISPKAHEEVQAKLTAEQAEKETALSESQEMEKEMQRQRQEFEERVAEYAKERDSSQRLASVQEDFNKRAAELQTRSEQELQELKESLSQREQEIADLVQQLKDKEAKQQEIIAERLKEAEATWERGLASVESTSLGQVKEIQKENKLKIQEMEEKHQSALNEEREKAENASREKSMAVGEKRALQYLYDSLESKYLTVLQNMESETEKYIKEHFDVAVQNKTDEMALEWTKKFQDLETKSRLLLEEAHMTSKHDLEAARVEAQKEHAKLQEEMVTKAALHEKELNDAHEISIHNLDAARAEAQAAQAKLEEEMAKKVALHEKELKEAHEASERALEAARAEAQEEQKRLEQERANDAALHAKELAEAAEELKQAESRTREVDGEKQETIKKLEFVKEQLGSSEKQVFEHKRHKVNLETSLSDMRALYKEALEDVSYWKSRFEQRSYINSTQLMADTAVHYEKATKVASETLQKHRQVVEKASEPYVKKGREVYDVYMKGHVDKAYEISQPHYEKNVAPLLLQAWQVWEQAKERARVAADDGFNNLVAQYKEGCAKSDWMECRDPEEFVATFLRVFAVVVLFALRGVIWRLFRTSIRLVFVIIWFVTTAPTRFVLSTFSKKATSSPPPHSDSTPSSPTPASPTPSSAASHDGVAPSPISSNDVVKDKITPQ